MQTPDSFIEIDGQRFEVHSAQLVLYHCASSCADWDLHIEREGRLALSGTVEPAPMKASDLDGARLYAELRDIDACFGQLLDARITHYPLIDGVTCAPVYFDAKYADDRVLLTASYSFDWDRVLDAPGADNPESRSTRFEIHARVVALHRDGLS